MMVEEIVELTMLIHVLSEGTVSGLYHNNLLELLSLRPVIWDIQNHATI